MKKTLLHTVLWILAVVLSTLPMTGQAQITQTFNATGGNQTYTVTADGTVRITARGGDGGNNRAIVAYNGGGSGATVSASFPVLASDVLLVVAGEAGNEDYSSGGGGGSAVILKRGANSTLLLVAGGGGGAGIFSKGGGGEASGDFPPAGGANGGGGGFDSGGQAGVEAAGGGAGTLEGGGGGGDGFGSGDGGFGFGGGGGGGGGYTATPPTFMLSTTSGLGGGGGGYRGGDGATEASGSSGGSSFVEASGFDITRTDGTQEGGAGMDGFVKITPLCPAISASLTGTTAICAGSSSNLFITLTGGQGPYSLVYSPDGGNTTVPVNNYQSGAAISVSPTAPTTTYTLVSVQDANGCPATVSGSATVTVNPLPTTFAVSGGGSYCADGTGVAVGLDGSQSGVNYQLKRDNSNLGNPVPGTGAALSFGNQTLAGNYTVTATNATTNCMADMTGSATVTVNALPTLMPGPNQSVIYGYGSNCTTLTASASGGTGTLSLAWSTGATSSSIQVCPTQTTTYTVTATNAANCSVTRQITVTINDVRCGYGGVKVCLGGREQCIAQYLVPTYLRLGATLGGCNANVPARLSYELAQEVPFGLSLKAYPNPVHDAVTVEVLSPSAGPGTFQILDLSGRVRQSRKENLIEGLNEVEFRLGSLPTGIYLIKVIDALNQQGVVRVSKE